MKPKTLSMVLRRAALTLIAPLAMALPASAADDYQVDVCVYGATPAGIMAACAAKSEGKSVLLIEPGRRIGGQRIFPVGNTIC